MTGTAKKATRDWQSLDAQHYLHPFTDFHDLGRKGSRIITRAEGVYIHDSDGRRILDGMAGLWCVNLGYGRRDLAEVAYRQLLELPYYNSFFQCSHPPAIELADLLAELSPGDFQHVFFTGSGSEANDTQIRLIRRYWTLMGEPERMTIIARKNAYHGSTIAGASLGGMGPMHEQTVLTVPGIAHIDQPYHFKLGGDLDPDEFGLQQARLLEEKILELGPEKVAAFFAEPVQGAGGVIIPPDTYWPEIQRICDEYGILLVADEVITAFGRLGHWFGSEHFGIRPDLISFAKGVSSGYLPLGGALVGKRVADVITAKGGEFAHGYTYSGHPACCAVALAALRAMQDEHIIEYVRDDLAPYFNARWAALADHPIIGEARSVGMVGAIEIVRDKSTRARFDEDLGAGTRCRDLSVDGGLVMRAVGDTMIVSPPLVADHGHIDELVDKAWQSLDRTAASLAAEN
ncbi:aspartate aminotransferase family protein [Elongatibacter sediminis]|uniref:Aspartate aminotransferase family protein n=1 Tax=Elongatibacter sediminis TaxID=3119006 RepID=A0AAW9R8H8_9GAMM